MSALTVTWATKTPMTAVASSGAEDPAAMKVAPATSGGMFKTENKNILNYKRNHSIFRKTLLLLSSI